MARIGIFSQTNSDFAHVEVEHRFGYSKFPLYKVIGETAGNDRYDIASVELMWQGDNKALAEALRMIADDLDPEVEDE